VTIVFEFLSCCNLAEVEGRGKSEGQNPREEGRRAKGREPASKLRVLTDHARKAEIPARGNRTNPESGSRRRTKDEEELNGA